MGNTLNNVIASFSIGDSYEAHMKEVQHYHHEKKFLKTGNVEKAAKLLNEGVDINATNHEGRNKLCLSVVDDNYAMVEFLLQRGAVIDYSALLHAVIFDRLDIVKLFIDRGCDISMIDNRGNHVLMQAHAEIAELLLQNGADPNQANNNGVTPLMHEAMLGTAQKMQLLINYGAKVNAEDKTGETALMRCMEWPVDKHVDKAAVLLQNGADKDVLTCLDMLRSSIDCANMIELLSKYN